MALHEPAEKKRVKDEADFLRDAREQYRQGQEAETETRELAYEDLEFFGGKQWPDDILSRRDAKGRPSLTINRLATFVDRIVGDQRQNRPSIKARPVDNHADPEVADVIEGLIRNIESVSNADIAYDTAYEYAVICGMGFFRITTDYADEDTFEQDIRIEPIYNPFSVTFDPGAVKYDRSDAQYAFVDDVITRAEFERRFPKAQVVSFDESRSGDIQDWFISKDKVRIAEYWYKEPVKRKIYQLSNGIVKWEEDLKPGDDPVKDRVVDTFRIYRAVISGVEILEGPYLWPGKYIPIIPVWGRELNLNGKRVLRGLVRFAKDPQRLYNYWRSADCEMVALAPKSPYLVTPAMIEGHEKIWSRAHEENYNFLPYNPDPQLPGVLPKRELPPPLSTALQQNILISADEIKATTGIFDASLGARRNETSGRAIIARQRESDIGTFGFLDNLTRSIEYAGRILIDLIPKIYDTARVVRVRGFDESEQFVEVNKPVIDEDVAVTKVLNDLTVGKYDVVVTVGPSYNTQRMEAADSLIKFIQAIPQAGALMADLVAENMDWPGADKISRRLKKILPTGIE